MRGRDVIGCIVTGVCRLCGGIMLVHLAAGWFAGGDAFLVWSR